MVNKTKTFLLLALVGTALVGCGAVNSSPFNETTVDLLGNNREVKKLNEEPFVGSDAEVAHSPTYVQYGQNDAGNYVLRFATAVKGAIESITYTRAPLANETNAHVKNVRSLYASIMAFDEVRYYTADGLSKSEEDKGQYYWACYCIEYTTTERYGADLNVSFAINGEVVDTVDTSLQDLIDYDSMPYKSIYIDGDVYAEHGENINESDVVVKAVNKDDTVVTLDPAEYYVTSAKVARLGEAAKLEVVHNQDSRLTAEKEVIVTQRVEGEDGIVVGGTTKTEAEYSSSFVKGENITFAGDFAQAVIAGNEGSLTLNYFSKTDHIGGFKMKVSNSNLEGKDGVNKMKPLQFNTICDLFVNNENINVSSDVIIPGTGVYNNPNDFAPVYGVYNFINIDNVQFKAGLNTLKFKFKLSTIGEKNSWGESPSTFNVDYVDFYSTGVEINKDATVVSVDGDATLVKYGDNFADVCEKLAVKATMSDGMVIGFDNEEIAISSVSGGDREHFTGVSEDTVVFGEYSLNCRIDEYNYEGVCGFNVTVDKYLRFDSADLKVVNNRMLYVLHGRMHGYKPSELEIYDGSNVIPAEKCKWIITLDEFNAEIDVTDYPASKNVGTLAFKPHLRINGVPYNGSDGKVNNSNGGNLEKFSYHNKIAYLNSKRFRIVEEDGMPALRVSTFDYGTYDAVITDVSLTVHTNNNLYYTVSGYAYNVDVSKIQVCDDGKLTRNTYISDSGGKSYDSTTGKFEIRCYLPYLKDGAEYWTHIKVDKQNYAINPGNGDLNNSGSINYRTTIHGNQEITTKSEDKESQSMEKTCPATGSKYKLFIKWGMPVLKRV